MATTRFLQPAASALHQGEKRPPNGINAAPRTEKATKLSEMWEPWRGGYAKT
jgi:hypothetical protein